MLGRAPTIFLRAINFTSLTKLETLWPNKMDKVTKKVRASPLLEPKYVFCVLPVLKAHQGPAWARFGCLKVLQRLVASSLRQRAWLERSTYPQS